MFDARLENAFWQAYNLKPEKFKFCRREVDFGDYHVGWDAYKPPEERLAAVMNFSRLAEPTLIDIRS